MRTNRSPLVLIALVMSGYVCSIVTACAAPAERSAQHGAKTADLEGRDWEITQFYLHDELLARHPQLMWVPRPYLVFERGTIKGSPGCGQFAGVYRRTADQLTITADWTDNRSAPCNADQRDDAAKMLQALAHVRSFHVPPAYWGDGLILNDNRGKIQIGLGPMEVGKDLAEFHDTFWHLTRLTGTRVDLSQIVIGFDATSITLSSPSYLVSCPFDYRLNGLKFHPPWRWGGDPKNIERARYRMIAQAFEEALSTVRSYEMEGQLTFRDETERPIIMLSPIRPTGIEMMNWRVAQYAVGDTEKPGGADLIDAKEPATLLLLHGRVDGSPGCGAWQGEYKLDGDQLEFHAGALLAGLCRASEETQSDQVQKAFKAKMVVEQQGSHILLRDLHGNAQVLLVPFSAE